MLKIESQTSFMGTIMLDRQATVIEFCSSREILGSTLNRTRKEGLFIVKEQEWGV